MLCLCPLSGTYYRTSNFSGKWKAPIEVPHPIFSAPLDHLLQRSGQLIKGELSPQEDRLLFTALLHNTGMVDFRCSATPSPITILRYSERLLHFIGWYDGAWRSRLQLPRIVIDHPTRKLRQLGGWLEAWEAERTLYLATQITRKMRDEEEIAAAKQERREAALYRIIHSATRSSDQYSGRLAAWAMEASAVPLPLRELWTSYFRLSGIQIFSVDEKDLRELLDHMEGELDIFTSPIFTGEVLKHLRNIVRTRELGMEKWIDGDSFGIDPLSDTPWRLLDEDLPGSLGADQEGGEREKIAPPVLDDPSSYPSRIAYLRAKGTLELWQDQQRELAKREGRVQKLLEEKEKAGIEEVASEAPLSLEIGEISDLLSVDSADSADSGNSVNEGM